MHHLQSMRREKYSIYVEYIILHVNKDQSGSHRPNYRALPFGQKGEGGGGSGKKAPFFHQSTFLAWPEAILGTMVLPCHRTSVCIKKNTFADNRYTLIDYNCGT